MRYKREQTAALSPRKRQGRQDSARQVGSGPGLLELQHVKPVQHQLSSSLAGFRFFLVPSFGGFRRGNPRWVLPELSEPSHHPASENLGAPQEGAGGGESNRSAGQKERNSVLSSHIVLLTWNFPSHAPSETQPPLMHP